MPSSKEGSVVFNLNQQRNRDIINDTHTDQSEKCRLEYLESNESSLMIKTGNANFKTSSNYFSNKRASFYAGSHLLKERGNDTESHCSQSMIIKPPKRERDRRHSSSVENFMRRKQRDSPHPSELDTKQANLMVSNVIAGLQIPQKEICIPDDKWSECGCKAQEESQLNENEIFDESSRNKNSCQNSPMDIPRRKRYLSKIRKPEIEAEVNLIDICATPTNKDNDCTESEFDDKYNHKNPYRAARVLKYLDAKKRRNYKRGAMYPSRQKVAEMRPRVGGRFISKEEIENNSSKTPRNIEEIDYRLSKPKPKKKPGRKRKYDNECKVSYSELEQDISKGLKIFKTVKIKKGGSDLST